MFLSEKYMNIVTGYECLLYFVSIVIIINKIFCQKAKKIPLIISLIIIGILSAIIAIIPNRNPAMIVFFIITVAQFILLKLIFPNQKISTAISIYIFINCINILIITLITPFGTNALWYSDIIINTLTFILILLICFSNIRLNIQQVIKLTPKYIFILIIILLVFTNIVAMMFICAPLNEFEAQWSSISRVGLILSLIGVCLLLPILLVNAVSSNHLKNVVSNYEKQINIQAEHYKQLAESNYEMRCFRHDFKNMSIALEEYIKKDEKSKSLKLIQELNNTLENPLERPYIFETGNGIADALLSDKQAIALNSNIKINFQGSISNDILSPTDLCVMLGNTLDNAIEACQKFPLEQEKAISIQCKCTGNFLFYNIVNPVTKKIEITNNYIATSKENQTLHGFGLYSLNSVVKKYNGEIKLSSTNDEFSVNIDLCMV